MYKYLFAFVFACMLCSLPATALPVEAFASLPDVNQVRLSPNGEQISSIIRIDTKDKKGTAIEVVNLKTGEKKLAVFTDNTKYNFNWVSWKDNNTLLIGLIYPDKRELWTGFNSFHEKTRETRLMIVDLKNNKNYTPFSNNFIAKYKFAPIDQATVVDVLADDPDNILMALPTNQTLAYGSASYAGVFKVNYREHKVSMVQGSEDHIQSWMTDQQHRVRVGFYYDYLSGLRKTIFKTLKGDSWQEAWPNKIFSEQSVTPLGFGLDPNVLYISAYHEKRLAIFKVNLLNKDLSKELVFSDPKYDVDGQLIYSPITKDVIGITYSTHIGNNYFEPDLKKLQASINKALPKTVNVITALSNNMQTFILYTSSDIDSGTYYIGHRNPIKIDVLAYRYKYLEPQLMSPSKEYNYKARDGLAIEGFLTLPKNSLGKKLPTIIFPHGGPIAQDTDNFSYWIQYFADKGYAVLTMNFRGSSGQGLEFRNSGLKNWGMEMQDDIEDGARKLIADGIADEKSICIVGASYGGYAALEGVVKTPDFYQCAISFAGVSNVFELVKDDRNFWSSYNVVDEQIGNDNKHLREISPVNYADKIKVPVLLIHGENDRQVPVKHSIEMRDALIKAGKNVTYIELPNEDHYLMNNENRVATFKAIDSFLDKYLPVKKQ